MDMDDAESESAIDSVFDRGPSPAGLTASNTLSAAARETITKAWTEKGVRPMAFRFASAVAAVSDIDGSSRQSYDGYVGMLVNELGLDFGDSLWLRWRLDSERNDAGGTAAGFFSRYFGIGRTEPAATFDKTRTFTENVIEYHLGNVDHFHSFLSRGPRVAPVSNLRVGNGGMVEATIDEAEGRGPHHCRDFFVFGVCVVGRPGTELSTPAVRVIQKDGAVADGFRPAHFPSPLDGRQHKLLTIGASADRDMPAPDMMGVKTIEMTFANPDEAANVERVLLLNSTGDIILDRLAFLRHYNVEVGFITEHAGLHFRNANRAMKSDQNLAAHMEAADEDNIEAYNGTMTDERGDILFSTDSDIPHSFGRVFPRLSDDLEVRFVVPAAAASPKGWEALELVTPTGTRAGGGLYWARRTMPNVNEPEDGRKFDRVKSRGDTFAVRVARVVNEAAREPGLFWPIYTHLGALPRPERKGRGETPEAVVPYPYFEPGPMLELQDRVYNITGDAELSSRLWFTRASVLYDYALLVRHMATCVERPDADTVEIRSFYDPVLNKTLPRSAAQLYGQTFYVQDPWSAAVTLDGQPIETLVRNEKDQTGRPSVTIAESEIRHVVFDRLDPLSDSNCQLDGGKWDWIENEEPFAHGRLTVEARAMRNPKPGKAGRRIASLRIPLNGLNPAGAQLLTFKVRTGEGNFAGVSIETRTGGYFYFGDNRIESHLEKTPNAVGNVHFRNRKAGAWQTITIPFHDLMWRDDAKPGGPLPNHPIEAVTIHGFAAGGENIEIGRVAFLRPRGTSFSGHNERRFCLAGSIAASEAHRTVNAVALNDPSLRRSIEADQRGHFCFEGLPAGIYKVWSEAGTSVVCDRRGVLVDVSADVVNLKLGRPANDTPLAGMNAAAAE